MFTILGTNTLNLWKLSFKTTLLVAWNNKSSKKHFTLPGKYLTHEGHDERAEWWNNPIGAWELRNKPILSTLVQQICLWSLFLRIKPVWYEGAKLGSKRSVAQHTFSPEIVRADEGALLRECVVGACCGSKLPRVHRPHWRLRKLYNWTTQVVVLNNKSRLKTYIIIDIPCFWCAPRWVPTP